MEVFVSSQDVYLSAKCAWQILRRYVRERLMLQEPISVICHRLNAFVLRDLGADNLPPVVQRATYVFCMMRAEMAFEGVEPKWFERRRGDGMTSKFRERALEKATKGKPLSREMRKRAWRWLRRGDMPELDYIRSVMS